jgi:hypothetical protein
MPAPPAGERELRELAERFVEAVIGEDPLPPFHPSCSCTASAA